MSKDTAQSQLSDDANKILSDLFTELKSLEDARDAAINQASSNLMERLKSDFGPLDSLRIHWKNDLYCFSGLDMGRRLLLIRRIKKDNTPSSSQNLLPLDELFPGLASGDIKMRQA